MCWQLVTQAIDIFVLHHGMSMEQFVRYYVYMYVYENPMRSSNVEWDGSSLDWSLEKLLGKQEQYCDWLWPHVGFNSSFFAEFASFNVYSLINVLHKLERFICWHSCYIGSNTLNTIEYSPVNLASALYFLWVSVHDNLINNMMFNTDIYRIATSSKHKQQKH